jgi:uncharacterized delta-60 repeat protein
MSLESSSKFVKKLKNAKFSKPIINFFDDSNAPKKAKTSTKKYKLQSQPVHRPATAPTIIPAVIAPTTTANSKVLQSVHTEMGPGRFRGRFKLVQSEPLKVGVSSHKHTHEYSCDEKYYDDDCKDNNCKDNNCKDDKNKCNNNNCNDKCDVTSEGKNSPTSPNLDHCFGVGKSGIFSTDVSKIISNGTYNGDAGALFNIVKSGLAVQSDGKILTGVSFKNGSTSNSNTRNIAVLRTAADGSTLDNTFGTNGIWSYNFSGSGSTSLGDSMITGIAIQADGKILLSGFVVSVFNNPYILPSGFVIRLNVNGTLDTSWNSTGINIVSLGAAVNSVVGVGAGVRFNIFSGIKIQSNGSIVVAGTSASAATAAALPFYYLNSGTAYNPRSILIARFSVNGILDTSFGSSNTGIVETSYNNNNSYSGIAGLDILPDNSIIVGGFAADANNDLTSMDSLFAKFTSNGSIDTSFNNGTTFGNLAVQGVVVYPIPAGQSATLGGTASTDSIYDIVVDKCNNKIIGAGIAVTPSISIDNMVITGSDDFSVVQLNFDGSLDLKFNGIGYNLIETSTGVDAAWGVDVDESGNIYAVGYNIESTTNFRKIGVVKLNKFGAILQTFINSNMLSSGDNYASNCILTDKNHLLVAVTIRNNSNNDLNAGIAKFDF